MGDKMGAANFTFTDCNTIKKRAKWVAHLSNADHYYYCALLQYKTTIHSGTDVHCEIGEVT